MAHDEENATEHTHLLPRDRRIGSIVHDAESESIISSHVSRDEQLMGETSVGERLPYNDYTTIDWLHDLVCCNLSTGRAYTEVMNCRSRTLSDIVPSTTARAYATLFSQAGIHVRDGLQPP